MIKREDIAKWLDANFERHVGVIMSCAGKESYLADLIHDCITELSLIEEVKARQGGKEVDVTIEELERDLTSKKMERAK